MPNAVQQAPVLVGRDRAFAAAASAARLKASKTDSLRMPYWFGFVLGLPLFFHVQSGGISLGESVVQSLRTPGIDVPLSALVVPALVACLLVPRFLVYGMRVTALDGYVAFFAFANLTACLVGTMLPMQNGRLSAVSLSFAFTAQTLLPLTAYVFARTLPVDDPRVLDRFIAGLIDAVTVAILLLLAQTFVSGAALKSGLSDHAGPFYVTKIKRYFPAVVNVAGALTLVRLLTASRRTVWMWTTVVVLLAAPLAIWSRAAVATAAVAILLAVFLTRNELKIGTGTVTTIYLASGLLAIVVLVHPVRLPGVQFRPLRRLTEMTSSQSAVRVSDTRHVAALVNGIETGLSTPVGAGYRASMRTALDGVRYDFARVAVTENEYTDYLAKGGFATLVAFVALLVASLRLGKQSMRESSSWMWRGLFAALLSIVLISNEFQVNFIEPTSGFVLWALLGLLGSNALHLSRRGN